MGISELIQEGKTLKNISSKTEMEDRYNKWCRKLRLYMKENEFSDKEQEEAKVNMYYTKNEYSESDTRLSLEKAIKNPNAFKTAFERDLKRDGKTVKIFIMQAVEF